MNLKISPSVGVARLGNSTQFYLGPETIGGLPIEADEYGNSQNRPVENFKDESSRVKRQGQVFKVLIEDGEDEDGKKIVRELKLDSPNVKSIEWTVHLANKKAEWYDYKELKGNLLYGEENSYKNQHEKKCIELRNAKEEDRQKLFIDPGPGSISGTEEYVELNGDNAPCDYTVRFPDYSGVTKANPMSGTKIETLGELRTDNKGRLIVLGGYGHAGGTEPLASYGGSDTWHDDISDGPVYCTVSFNDGTAPISLQAWVIVGSPKFAPELVNISTLSDSMFDVAVRKFDLVPDMYHDGAYDDNYVVNYQRDILPIIKRMDGYRWVANIPSMTAFASNIFDFSDPSESNKENRMRYFSYFRKPNELPTDKDPDPDPDQSQLFKEDGDDVFPMMPLSSGSNSVSNQTIVKFLALNETQYFMLDQWAKGSFENNPDPKPYPVSAMDQVSVGNCVGLPMSPGIEVTWSVQHENIYSAPYVILDRKGPGGYNEKGLTPTRDECEEGENGCKRGCEPGDLTKRMACPWQADFFQCTVQPVNFTNPEVNKVDGEPLPPTYYSYWWPPQSPWDVLTGEHTLEGQSAAHLPAGQQINYARGINSFVQMVEHWSALAFIRNRNSHDPEFPYFTETERNHALFSFKEVGVGQVSGNDEDDGTSIPVFYIDDNKASDNKARMLATSLEKQAFHKIPTFHKIKVAPGGLKGHRSGPRRIR